MNNTLDKDNFLLSQWNFEKNLLLDPTKITLKSTKIVWWKCKNNHEWKAPVSNRNRGASCPLCDKKTIISTNKILMDEWCFDKNSVLPENIDEDYIGKIWWICKENNHIWKDSIKSRIGGKKCPYCKGKTPNEKNCLLTIRPEVCNEWNYEKNVDISPSDVCKGSSRIVWWKCINKGHEWEAPIYMRTRKRGNGCPKCNKGSMTSFVEQVIFFYLSTIEECINGLKIEDVVEVDIFIPKYNIAIEYDGAWHKEKVERDIKKYYYLKERNINLIRIREYGLPVIESDFCIIRENQTEKSIIKSIETLLLYLKENYNISSNVDFNLDRDRSDILQNIQLQKSKKSFASVYPELLKIWNYEKNENLTPDLFSFSSAQKVWWKCLTCPNEYQERIYNKVKANINCSICNYKIGKEKYIKNSVHKTYVPINQYTKEGIFIKTWESISSAAKEFNIGTSSLSKVCRFKKKSYKGYIWRYSQEVDKNNS